MQTSSKKENNNQNTDPGENKDLQKTANIFRDQDILPEAAVVLYYCAFQGTVL